MSVQQPNNSKDLEEAGFEPSCLSIMKLISTMKSKMPPPLAVNRYSFISSNCLWIQKQDPGSHWLSWLSWYPCGWLDKHVLFYFLLIANFQTNQVLSQRCNIVNLSVVTCNLYLVYACLRAS